MSVAIGTADETSTGSDDPDGPSPRAAPAARRDLVAYGSLILMVLIGSTGAMSAKLAVRELPPTLLPIVRFGLAGLCLLPWALRKGGLARMLRQDWPQVLLAATLCVPLNQFFFLGGARLAPTTHIGLIYATCPLVVLLAACFVGLEQMRANRLIGVLASVSGIVVLGLGNLASGAGAATEGVLLGDLMLVGAVLSWGVYMTASKPLIARHGPLTALSGTFLTGSLLTLPLGLAALPDWWNADAPSTLDRLANASSTAWIALVYLTLVISVVGLMLQNTALRRLDASEVATVGNGSPLLTVVWGGLFLGESITPWLILGAALTVGGILWTGRSSRRGAWTAPRPKARPAVEPAGASA